MSSASTTMGFPSFSYLGQALVVYAISATGVFLAAVAILFAYAHPFPVAGFLAGVAASIGGRPFLPRLLAFAAEFKHTVEKIGWHQAL